MTDILFTANGASATALVSGELTSGMVGLPVRFSFDSDWDGLNIVAVFDGGGQRISVPLLTDMEAVLPWEVIAKANTRLRIGAEGRKSDGSVVIPTVWANAGYITEGAVATDEEGNPPTPGIYDQIMAAIKAGQLKGDPGKDGDDGISPVVDVVEIEGGHRVTITDKNGKQVFDVMNGKSVSVVDNLGSSDPNAALSARMGSVLKAKIEDDVSALSEHLQPQINQRVKTVNGISPDANGNVVVQGGGNSGGVVVEADPTVPAWAKQPNKPTYTADEVGALPASTVIPAMPTVDSTLSATSTNPIQNKAVAQKFSSLEADMDRIEGAIPTDTYINTLIDAKLGVIENGTY